MALLFADSFDHYVTADLLTKWTNHSSGTINSAAGRWSSSGYRSTNSNFYTEWAFPSALATVVVGGAYRTNQIGTNNNPVFTFFDGTTFQVSIQINTSGKLEARRGVATGTLLGTGTFSFSNNTHYYIEAKITFNDTTGVVVVKVNTSTTDLNLTSQDTNNGAGNQATKVRLGYDGNGSGGSFDMDDFYVLDTTGSAPTNDFLGDCRVEALFPNGNGNSSVLAGSDGNSTDNYLLVDEAAPNSDTDYVESSTVNDKDTYTFTNLTPTTGTVYGVQVLPFAKKTDAGARSIASVARLSATEVDSSNKTLTSSYIYLPDIREAKPGGGVWSISDVNSAEFGVKVTA
jgi:hypothetical protein